ncbi:MAG: alpha/beta fold hydrolase, partial [Alphaproteobacteria bacterium]
MNPEPHPYEPPAYLAGLGLPPLTRRMIGGIAVTSAGQGAPVVLVHGGSGSWSHWARNVGPLAERFA